MCFKSVSDELGNKAKAVAEEGLGTRYPLRGSAPCPRGLGRPNTPANSAPGCGCAGLGVGIAGGARWDGGACSVMVGCVRVLHKR